MKFKDELQTLFLDKSSGKYNLDKNVNIVLSPSLYWVQKLELPVKYLYEVKKLIPSLFEDILPPGNYSYSAYKSRDAFFLFAYEDKVILDLLNEKGISLSNVKNIHFAQSEFQDLQSAVKISETQSLYIKEELLILVPCCWVKEAGAIDIKNITLSKHTITLSQFNHIVDKKSLYTIGFMFVGILLLISAEWFITSQKIQKVDQMTSQLFEKHKLKPTMLQNKALLKKYSSIHTRQTRLRESMAALLSVKLTSGYSLTFINVKNKLLTASFNIKDKLDKEKVLKFLKSKKMKFSSSFKDDKLVVEIKL